MGKIKKEIIPKPQRVKAESKPPSVRRARRFYLRGATVTQNRVAQFIPPTLILKLKKKHRPTVTIVHEHYSDERKDKVSEQVVEQLTAPLSSAFAKELREIAALGKGKLKFLRGKTIWHEQGIAI